MSDLTVRRWRRYGHDRLYVNDADGQSVAAHDLQSGVTTFNREDGREAAMQVLRSHPAFHEHRGQVAGPPVTPVPRPRDAEEAPRTHSTAATGRDLAQNRPGQAVQAKRDEAWQEVKSRGRFNAYLGRLFDAKTDERAWRKGAEGERWIGHLLEKHFTGKGWKVLHAVPISEAGTDIDHLLIGPAGVLSVNTKMHTGARVSVYPNSVWVNGTKQPYLPKSRAEARTAQQRLTAAIGQPVSVTPVVCFLCESLTLKNDGPTDVLITSRTRLKALLRLPTTMSADEIEAVYAAARQSTTWLPTPA